MTALRTIPTVAGSEYLNVTTDGLGIIGELPAIRTSVGFEYLIVAVDRVTR